MQLRNKQKQALVKLWRQHPHKAIKTNVSLGLCMINHKTVTEHFKAGEAAKHGQRSDCWGQSTVSGSCSGSAHDLGGSAHARLGDKARSSHFRVIHRFRSLNDLFKRLHGWKSGEWAPFGHRSRKYGKCAQRCGSTWKGDLHPLNH